MKRILLFLFAAYFVSCSSTKSTTTNQQRIPAKFDFNPPSRDKVGASNITIALVRPQFVGKDPEYYVAPFKEMAISMANDFQELLTAKGFTIRGPFGSHDEMVYNDKLNSNFTLEVSIDLDPEYNRHYTAVMNWGLTGNPLYKTSGEVTLAGSLIIKARAPQHNELLWTKNIQLDRSSFTYTGSEKWEGQPSMAEELREDNAVYNTITRQLEEYYTKALNLAWRQIDPDEMKGIAAEAAKADAK